MVADKIQLRCPNLDPASPATEAELNTALADAQAGAEVLLSVLYFKVTSWPARIPNVDYRPLLGAERSTLIGPVREVAIGRYGPYVTLDATLTRAPLGEGGEVDPDRPGWTTIRGDGIRACQVLKNTAEDARRRGR